ncbi:MAG: NADH-quinone oxidoreductase subunit C [Nitrospiraceae bacterium]|nr:NADH-quinone oxidoreductase subunit C [Nitrospiraceae bacterium]
MEAEQIAKMIEEKFPGEVTGTVSHAGQIGVMVKPERIRDICRFLHDDPALRMDHLADVTAVDYSSYPADKGPRFEVVYNMISTSFRHRIRLKARVSGDNPRIDTVTPVWATANWHERETYDLMGIVFNGHPDLRRILLPEDWVGHPLRKEYPLKGY